MGWKPVGGDAMQLLQELRREAAAGHPLFGQEVTAVARRFDGDDVLFALEDGDKPFVVVHLTWFGASEQPPYPVTTFYCQAMDNS